ncbi:hypothetical protein GUJ93_ZPchr0001g32775 [Zizania palustris]|uniref:Uncharacterized protein n=1 Tax=Zizania palustris TaxID=103762 RepID=A0A8J5RPM0_ZIZPA|nr:hypothetical protein GUJ93_ZPchr0001g32775 [Zizania palustris]
MGMLVVLPSDGVASPATVRLPPSDTTRSTVCTLRLPPPPWHCFVLRCRRRTGYGHMPATTRWMCLRLSVVPPSDATAPPSTTRCPRRRIPRVARLGWWAMQRRGLIVVATLAARVVGCSEEGAISGLCGGGRRRRAEEGQPPTSPRMLSYKKKERKREVVQRFEIGER